MSPWIAIGLGSLLGAAGAFWHLGVVWLRARSLPRLQGSLTMILAPVGWIGPGAAVLFAVRVEPVAAWGTLLGLFVARTVALRHLRSEP